MLAGSSIDWRLINMEKSRSHDSTDDVLRALFCTFNKFYLTSNLFLSFSALITINACRVVIVQSTWSRSPVCSEHRGLFVNHWINVSRRRKHASPHAFSKGCVTALCCFQPTFIFPRRSALTPNIWWEVYINNILIAPCSIADYCSEGLIEKQLSTE